MADEDAPRSFRVSLYSDAGDLIAAVEVPDDEYLLDALQERDVVRPEVDGCLAGVCSACLMRLRRGTVDQSDQAFLSDEEAQQGFVVSCVAYAAGDCELVVDQEQRFLSQVRPDPGPAATRTLRTLVLRGLAGTGPTAAEQSVLERLADDWNVHRAAFEQPGDGLSRHVYRDDDGTLELSLVEDLAVPARYLVLQAGDPGLAGEVDAWLEANLDTVGLAELYDTARHAPDDPAALVRLALACPDVADPGIAELVLAGLTGADRAVRRGAVEAAAMLHWPELLPGLRGAVHDPDPGVRRVAQLGVRSAEARAGGRSAAGA